MLRWSDPSVGIPRRLMNELAQLVNSVTYFVGDDAIPGYDLREKVEFMIVAVLDEYVRGYEEERAKETAMKFSSQVIPGDIQSIRCKLGGKMR